MHIKIDGLNYTNIKENGYKATLENVYAQARRTNTLKMVKVLIGQVYTVSVTFYNVYSSQMQQLQKKALLPEIPVEFYDEDKKNYRTENMYCSTVEKTVKRELKNGEMLYDEVTVNFIGNEKVNR